MDGARVLAFSESADTLAELLGLGRTLDARPGARVSVVAIGPAAAALAQDCVARGADEALVLETPAATPPGPEEFLLALAEAVRVVDPDIILVGATRTGSDVVARLAQRLQAPCASACMALHLDADGSLAIERRLYGGRFVARQRLKGRPLIASVPPSRFAKAESAAAPHGTITPLQLTLPSPRARTRSVSERARSAVDVTKAEVIVAAGRGVRKAEDIALLDKLAAALGGVLAGSRPLTGDVDWLPADRRVGLSGQTVKPNLYIACGISGQIEHIVGMKGARTVVAINNDPKAPIHAEADYSVVGDLYEIVPAFLDALERAMRD